MSEREEKRLYTFAEFFELFGERRMELYEGTPVLMPPASYEHGGGRCNWRNDVPLYFRT
ncbi:hypothetical protein GCM10022628_04470 [Anoxybacillus suryakundensis]|uniref:Uma2 family endonuclease n=1 Tax=Anoxybacillus suryakundensis TaxID=1325335 RepID=A0A0K6GPM9_9BACL|nr:hypothetical protein [Anoxybacillus suryakundensis]CUA80674.1 hypothetical protein Ga0061060_1139 [Anoxybacillus suryakundensis]